MSNQKELNKLSSLIEEWVTVAKEMGGQHPKRIALKI